MNTFQEKICLSPKCQATFKPKRKNSIHCSKQCRNDYLIYLKMERNNNQYKEKIANIDYVTCEICGLKAKQLSFHINIHHKITQTEYKKKFNAPTLCQNSRDSLSLKIKGKNNPGYQHNGKFSVYSNKFIHKTETSKINAINKMKMTKQNNLQNENTHVEYYLNQGFIQEEAIIKRNERQRTFALEKCISRWGEIEGTKKWNERQERWQRTLNAKSDEEKAEINRKKIWKGGKTSKTEKELYTTLHETFQELKGSVYIKNQNHYIVCDMVLINKIIEYQGDYWHGNPNKYHPDDILYRNSTAEMIWNKDKKRETDLKNLGYEILVIWESDYKKNKEETIQKCINFLTQ